MTDINLQTITPDTTLPTTGFLFGADSQASGSPSVYTVQSVATTLLGSTTLSGATITADAPVLNLAQTWNAGGVTFTGLKLNATDTASAAGSLLLDIGTGGGTYASRFSVSKSGSITVANQILAAGSIASTLGSLTLSAASAAIFITNDTILTRRGERNLRFGAADAATALAQTLSVQSVVAGTTNTAGANLTITGSQGTGTGAGGSIIFQVAPAGSSGTAQNALATALTINSAGQLLFAGSASVGLFKLAGQNYIESITGFSMSGGGSFGGSMNSSGLTAGPEGQIGFSAGNSIGIRDTVLRRDGAANTLALRNGANAQESRVYGSYTSATNFQRMSIKTLRESSGALSGATYVTTIAIPAYANLIGVTTRVTTEVTGATTYDVGDGSDVDLWGAAIGIVLGSQSQTSDFTAVGAVGAAATSRTVTLTANGSNFTGGVIEICLHYLTTEAD